MNNKLQCCAESMGVDTDTKKNSKNLAATYFLNIKRSFLRLSYLTADFTAILKQDPALKSTPFNYPEVILYAGFWALMFYRIAHLITSLHIPLIPRLLSQTARLLTGIEIHPKALIGPGLFIDHGMGVVIGETTVIGSNVIIFQGVTLGGISNTTGKRHPTVGNNVFIGAGAKVLGNINLGDNSKIGAQAVVLKNVPSGMTAVGIPAKIIKPDNMREKLLAELNNLKVS